MRHIAKQAAANLHVTVLARFKEYSSTNALMT
jgi:hypothetical protein